jgi:hypothetical protein
MPARNYQATVRLLPLSNDAGTVIEWSAIYDAEMGDEELLAGVFVGLYNSFIDALLECTEVVSRYDIVNGCGPLIPRASASSAWAPWVRAWR